MKNKTINLIILLLTLIASISTLNATESAHIIITEIGAHEPSNLEWIEIYNPTQNTVNLEGLIFFENQTNHSTEPKTSISVIAPDSYGLIVNKFEDFIQKYPQFSNELIIDSSWQTLSLEGEELSLKFGDEIIETINYKKFEDSKSLERIFSNSSYKNQWTHAIQENSILQVSSVGTQDIDEQNINTETQQCTVEKELIEVTQPIILLSEVSFNDESQDWIEIIIDSKGQEIKSQDLKIEIDSKEQTYNSDIVEGVHFGLFKTNLVGTTEQIKLIYKDEVVDSVCWQNETPPKSEQLEIENLKNNNLWKGACIDSTALYKGESIARTNFIFTDNSLNNWLKLQTPTPLETNIQKSKAPKIHIEVQSGSLIGEAPHTINLESKTDSETDLTYHWNFDNGEEFENSNPPAVQYSAPGRYTVELTAEDYYGQQTKAYLQIEVLEKQDKPEIAAKEQAREIDKTPTEQGKYTNLNLDIKIASFFPNPEGDDENKEWIEIENQSDTEANLNGWQIDDKEGQSKPYIFSNLVLGSNEKYRISNKESNITLNNSEDEIRIIKPSSEITERISYQNAKNDEIFIYDKISNKWTRQVSQNSTSLISSIDIRDHITSDEERDEIIEQKTQNSGQKNNLIKLTEIFPNPEGKDEGKEWIEVYNNSDKDTDLFNWKLKANSKTYSFLKNTIAKSNSYTLIKPENFSLPNSEAKITLLDASGEIMSYLQYTNAKENWSFYTNPDDNEWEWTEAPTPESGNPELHELEGVASELDTVNQTFYLDNQLIHYTDEEEAIEVREGVINIIEALYTNDKYILKEVIYFEEKVEEASTNWSLLLIPIGLAPAYFFRNKLKNLLKAEK